MFKLVLVGLFAIAQTVGDMVDLEKALNAREAAYFYGTENIKFTLPKGTKGKIEEVKNFASGNSGLFISIEEGPRKGQKVWIHFNPKNPSVTCNGKECVADPSKADKVVTKRDVPAIKDKPVMREKPAKKTSARRTGLPKNPVQIFLKDDKGQLEKQETSVPSKPSPSEQAVAAMKSANLKARSIEVASDKECPDGKCNVANAGLDTKVSIMKGAERASNCPSKKEEIGKLTIYQSNNNGICKLYVKETWDTGPRKSRSFDFRDDGEIEVIDPYGERQLRVFPRVNDVSYSLSADKSKLIIQTASNIKISISTATAQVVDVSPAKSFSCPAFNSESKGNREKESLSIQPDESSVILDTGYHVGLAPEQHSNISSMVRRGDGKTCTLSNTVFYNYINPDGKKRENFEAPVFRFKKDEDLEAAYNSKCKWK